MSAQALIATSNYPLMESGFFNTTATATGTVTFRVPFPTGVVPVVILQNTSGTTWDEINLGCFQANNANFTWTQNGTPSPEIFGVTYLAVWIPATPSP